jgi:membrane protein
MRTAPWCAAIGLVLSLVSFALFVIAEIQEGSGNDTIFSWAYPTVSLLSGGIVVAGYLGLARERGLLPAPHTSVAAMMAALTYVVATVAIIAWVIAFEAAKAHVATPPLGRLSTPLMVTYGVMGTLTAAVIIDGALSIRTRMHAVPRAALATMAGIPAIAVIPVVGMIPISLFGASTVLLILYRTLRRQQGVQQPPARSVTSPAPPVSPPSSHAGTPEYPGPLDPPQGSRIPGGLPDSYPRDALDDEALPTSHRVGMRLGRRTALWCGVLAVATCIGSVAVILAADYLPGRQADSPFFIRGALQGVAVWFLMVGVISLLRERAAVSPQHAAYASLFLTLALMPAAAVAALSMIDTTTDSSGSQNHWMYRTLLVLVITAWGSGAAAVGSLFDGLSACRRMEPGLRGVAGFLIGVLTYPLLWGLPLLLTEASFPAAIGLIIVGATTKPAPAPYSAAPPTTPRSRPRAAHPLSGRRITWIRLLAASAVVLGVGAIAWAIPDRAAGSASACLTFILVLTALALWASGRFPSSAVSTWGSATLAWASMLALAVRAWWPSLGKAFALSEVSVLCGGAAFAWTVFTWLPRRRILRVLAGAGAGLSYALAMTLSLVLLKDYFLFAFVPMLAPVYGLIILRRPPTPAPPAPGMSPAPAVPSAR